MKSKIRKKCSIKGCNKQSKVKGFCKKHYHKQYRNNNKEKIAEYHKINNIENKKEISLYHQGYYLRNKETIIKKVINYKTKKPWLNTLVWINQRIKEVKEPYVKRSYFDKGIKNFLTLDDLERLWFRDKADKMTRPSIHRKNNDGHYEFGNCKYIEFNEHMKIHAALLKHS